MNLGEKIVKIRKDNKMSQEDFAEIFNVTRQTISSWENAKSYPDIETLVKISDKFKISLDILLKEDIKMIKEIDKKVKDRNKYRTILIIIISIIVLIIGMFGVYSIKYVNTKDRLESKFNTALKENDFYKNNSGHYSMNYTKATTFRVPNQKMPRLSDFYLHFHATFLYCDIDLENTRIEIQWSDKNDFSASAISKEDDSTIGSTSDFKEKDFTNMKKLGDELGISEKEITEIIKKGNQLYQEFYE